MSRTEDRAFLFQRQSRALVPATEASLEALERLGGADVLVWLHKSRNPGHHKKLFSAVRIIFKNQSIYRTQDEMLDAVKIHLGFCKTIVMQDGRVGYVPESLSFDAMDELRFSAFYDAFMDMVFKRIIPGLTERDVRKQLEGFA